MNRTAHTLNTALLVALLLALAACGPKESGMPQAGASGAMPPPKWMS